MARMDALLTRIERRITALLGVLSVLALAELWLTWGMW
jgi:hypothetical protein